MRLFVIEGLDGAGKSTQIGLLKDHFAGLSHPCEYLHFPRTDAPWFGELIARFLRGEFGSLEQVDPYLVAMLYAGDRKDAAVKISSWLRKGRIVLLDRYTYSNIAYQCAKITEFPQQEVLRNWIMKLEFSHFGIPVPDLNVFLDVPFRFTEHKLSGKRSGNDRDYLNGASDIHENSLSFQEKVREIYLRVAETDDRLVVISCSSEDGTMLPPEAVFKKIIEVIKSRNLI